MSLPDLQECEARVAFCVHKALEQFSRSQWPDCDDHELLKLNQLERDVCDAIDGLIRNQLRKSPFADRHSASLDGIIPDSLQVRGNDTLDLEGKIWMLDRFATSFEAAIHAVLTIRHHPLELAEYEIRIDPGANEATRVRFTKAS